MEETITIDMVDIDLLREQRDFLFNKATAGEEISGILNLLDHMLDVAEGYKKDGMSPSPAEEKPTIFAFMQGGLVDSLLSDVPVQLVILDNDLQGLYEDTGTISFNGEELYPVQSIDHTVDSENVEKIKEKISRLTA